MFRIGEFSQMAQVTIRTLRHYDELGLLKPVHIDRFTDYRYYTIEQLPLYKNMHIHELPTTPMLASVIHRGSFYGVPQALSALFIWVGANGYTASGPYREIHLSGRENDLTDIQHLTVEMQVPIEKC